MSYNNGLWGEARLGVGSFYFDGYPPAPTIVQPDTVNIKTTIKAPTIITFDGIIVQPATLNVKVQPYDVTVFNTGISKDHYITVCGIHQPVRYGKNREINLVNYLPEYYKNSDVEDFLQVFQDFLNEMYDGYEGLSAIETPYYEEVSSATSGHSAVSATVDHIRLQDLNTTSGSDGYSTSASGKISILEKINRLTELHDASLMDEQYLQYFANYLGYNIDINYAELGNLALLNDEATPCSALDQGKYLRFAIENLPNWYKIKTTTNAVRVMLYSFGIIGDIIDYYVKGDTSVTATADNYNKGKFKREDDPLLTNDYFPSPHFAININLDDSVINYSFDYEKREQIINAIESIRPVNTVFDRISGYITRNIALKFNNPVSKSNLFITSLWQIPVGLSGTINAPTLLLPTDTGSAPQTSAIFNWTAESNAKYYNLYIDTNNAFPSPMVYKVYNNIKVIKTLAATVYYWKVYAVNEDTTSTASSTFSFTAT